MLHNLTKDYLKTNLLCFIDDDDKSHYFDKWINGKNLDNAKVVITQSTKEFFDEEDEDIDIPMSIVSVEDFENYVNAITKDKHKHFEGMYEDTYFNDNMLMYSTDICDIGIIF